MKSFGEKISNEFRKNKDDFNELWFRKSISAAIIFRTIDSYLDTNKDSAKRPTGFWYKSGGYKGNIVPYTVAKIISSIPQGLEIDWENIWKNQDLSPAFKKEIESVTKMANDFICDSHGMIVTEYCKRRETWENFRDNVKYVPSREFKRELVSKDEAVSLRKEARKDRKEADDLQVILSVISKGVPYWNNILSVGKRNNILTISEQTDINTVVGMAKSMKIPTSRGGKVPALTMRAVNSALSSVEKLETEGLLKNVIK